jgi:hypothetical protein
VKPNLASAWLLIGMASLVTRIVAGYDRAATEAARSEYVTGVVTGAAVILGLIVLAYIVYATVGRATLAALRFDNPDAIVFQSSPAAVTKLAVRRLQKLSQPEQPTRLLTIFSPIVVIDPSGLSIWRGKDQPERVLFVPRAHLQAVDITEIRDGFLTSPALKFTIADDENGTLLSVPVLLEGSALRGGSPEDVAALAERIRDLYDLSRADAEQPGS